MDTAIIWTVIGIGITVIGTGIAVVGFVYTFLRNFKEDVNHRIDSLDVDIKGQNARIDRLYQMFVDLLQAQSPKTHP